LETPFGFFAVSCVYILSYSTEKCNNNPNILQKLKHLQNFKGDFSFFDFDTRLYGFDQKINDS
jgi:hypothetical protein